MNIEEVYSWYATGPREEIAGNHVPTKAEKKLIEMIHAHPDGEVMETLLVDVIADWEEYGFRGGYLMALGLLTAK